jgi:transposase
MPTRKRRTYTPEFKLEAVKLLTEHGLSFADVSQRLEVADQVVRNWKSKYDAEGEAAFVGAAESADPVAELRLLREENRRLREQCTILKRAAAVFAQDAL